MSYTGHFDVLCDDECRRLLRSKIVGRVAWQSDQGLVILPVNYLVERDQIVFRTSNESLLAQLAKPTPVTFEVDDYDADAENGWSVVVHGTSQAGQSEDYSLLPTPWATGERSLVITIESDRFSGRAVSAAS